jgi:hypothetical protein
MTESRLTNKLTGRWCCEGSPRSRTLGHTNGIGVGGIEWINNHERQGPSILNRRKRIFDLLRL